MLIVATVQVGNFCGRGEEYVRKLFEGIDRHMPVDIEWRGVCLTDDPTTVPNEIEAKRTVGMRASWWHKLFLFSPNTFEVGSRLAYFDLDTVIVGDLRDIASYAGKFAIMRDVYYPDHMQSSVMAWEAGALDHVWTAWDRAGRPQFDPHGDQRTIERLQPVADRWQDLLPGQVVSFKKDCGDGVPEGARAVVYHGSPRPHDTSLWNETDINRKELTHAC